MSTVKRISILGSTGSIGKNTLDIVARNRGQLQVVSLASKSDVEGIVRQAREHKPKLVALFDEEAASDAENSLAGSGISVLSGTEGILEASTISEADTVVSAIVGAAGVMPTFAAVEAGKDVALANKEALVAAGSIITNEALRTGARILPIDSEHSAVFQAIMGQDAAGVQRVILTASGGPFFKKSQDFLDGVTPEMALDHPRWKMGPKVTVDSATMMNKGLEVIEAHWLFGVPVERIEVVVHPQSIIHSMVEFIDGSTLAQMGIADMRLPIAFALGYPDRMSLPFDPLDLTAEGKLEFFEPDLDFFPCLKLAYKALRRGGGIPAIMNAANEVAVEVFLNGQLPFTGIPQVVAHVMETAPEVQDRNLAEIMRGDNWARKAARDYIASSEENG
ncbi:MAG: 1-deoxy-D-xylulose-5-phosphate reductoisomerase [bacterium]